MTYNTDLESDGHFSDSEDELSDADNLDNMCPKMIKKRIVELEQLIEEKNKIENKSNEQ